MGGEITPTRQMELKHPKKLIDLHTHIFNAHYVPLAGIIASVMNKRSNRLANILASLINRIARSDYVTESKLLELSSVDSTSITPITIFSDTEINHYNEVSIESCIRLISDTTIFELDNELASSIEPLSLMNLDSQDLEENTLLKILSDLENYDYENEGWRIEDELSFQTYIGSFELGAIFSNYKNLDKNYYERVKSILAKAFYFLRWLANPKNWPSVHDFFIFLVSMLRKESDIINQLLTAYKTVHKDVKIVNYLMDMHRGYPGTKPPLHEFENQIERIPSITSRSQFRDKVINFSAFDPRRNTIDDNWKDIAIKSLDNGFVGFKFYPAMGYKPFGNDSAIQNVINDFYDFCTSDGRSIPIFVHCTPEGFETIDKFGEYADPQLWLKVLERWPNLRLCLGHAGGGYVERYDNTGNKEIYHGWLAKTDAEWKSKTNYAKTVVDLCVNYKNVYCEFAYMLSILDENANNKNYFINNLIRANATEGNDNFLDKVSYGSDWHMPHMIRHVANYYTKFVEIFNQNHIDEKYIDKFFYENAINFLYSK